MKKSILFFTLPGFHFDPMRRIMACIILFLAMASHSYSQSCPINADWESGDKTNWTCKYGGYGSGTPPNFETFYSTNSCINTGGNNATDDANNRHTVMGPGAGDDPNSINPLVPRVAPVSMFPSGINSYSFRIGNAATGGYNWPGPTPSAFNYAQAEAVTMTFTVTSQNAGFTYLFSTFVQDPGHDLSDQPRFEIVLKDQNGDVTPCGYYKVVGGDSLSNTFYLGTTTTAQWKYTNWAKVGLDLTSYIGQQVTLEFRSSDCFPNQGNGTSTTCISGVCTTVSRNGYYATTSYNNGNPTVTRVNHNPGTHSAYAYVDAYCSPLEIAQPLFCTGVSSVQIYAPPGYASYTWPSGQTGLSGNLNNDTVTISNPVSGTTYTVNMTSVTNCASTAKVTIQGLAVSVRDTSICRGATGPINMSASVTIPGSYTYSWTPSTGLSCTTCPNPTLTTIPTATTNYTVTVSASGAGCPTSDVLTINISPISVPITSTTHVSCNSGNNGGATVTPAGTPGYTYSWTTTPVQTTATATGLSMGTYTVRVTDSRSCSNLQTVTITQPATALSSTVTATTHVNCFGGNNGVASSVGGGGTPGYTYSWSPGGQTSQNISNITAGTYSVTVTDSKACTNRQTVVITQPSAALSTTATPTTHVSCFGNSTGSATATPSGGTTNYTYSWSTGGQTTQTATGLISGTYTVKVTDSKGCTTNQTVTITQPSAALSTTANATTNVDCFGNSTGSATATPSGGTTNYTYSWSTGGQTTQTATGLISGTYTVKVTDSKGCTTNQTVTITQPSAILTNTVVAGGSVSCFGGNNGTATATPGGGTPNYTYAWLPGGQTTSSISALSAGSYTVTVTDAHGCTTRQSVAITQPPGGLAVTAVADNNVNCFGGNNGTATANPSGGTPNYTYSWLPGNQTTSSISNLLAGSYTVTVTDAGGCSNQQTVAITQPPAVLTTNIGSQTNVNCFGNGTGSATANPSGGTTNYTYSWSTVPSQATQMATGLLAGSYTVHVTDAHGCTSTQTATITEPSINLTAGITNTTGVSCAGGNNGTATVTPNGGTPNYTYSWNVGQTGPTATGLGNGSFTVTVTDQNGCSTTAVAQVTQPAGALNASITGNTPASCKGAQNGTATVTASQGTPNYTYLWQPGGQTTATATGLSGGQYTVTVTDSKGCMKVDTITVTESQNPLIASITNNTPVTCIGSQDGSITISATGGTQAYTYSWSPNVSTTNTATGLTGGMYTITVTDLYGCAKTVIDSVKESTTPFNVNVAGAVPVTCTGSQNGSITVTATGGTQNYTYQWSPNVSTTNIGSNLAGGTYTITVTDKYGCIKTVVDTVKESANPFAVNVAAITPVTCIGSQNGSITVSATGGTQVYTYSWSPNVSTTNTATGLSGGMYTITVTDQYGCVKTVTDSVPESKTQFNINIASITPVTCTGSQNGSITVSATGGTQNYTYQWSPNVSTTNTGANLAGGTYTITVTDQYGCQRTVIDSVPESQVLLNINVNSTPAACDKDDGTITVTPTGGTPNYTYQWNPNISSTNTASNLPAGTWTVTVTDQYGCVQTVLATVNQPPGVIANFTFTPASGIAPLSISFNNGSLGGSGYQWNYGDTTITLVQDTILNPNHMFKDTGTYTIRLITYNSYGCADTVYATVRINMKSVLCIPNVFSPNGDGNNDLWKLCEDGIENLEVIIYDRWGLLIYQWDTPNGGWDGRTTAGQEVPEGTYYYIIKAKGVDGVDYGTSSGFLMLLRN